MGKKLVSFLISAIIALVGVIIPLENANAETTAANDVMLKYRAHVQNIGWISNYSVGGEISGTTGQSLRLEALQFNLQSSISGVKVLVQTHVQNIGWSNDWVDSNNIAGTTGQSLRLEAIRIKLVGAPSNYHIQYQTHVQNIGWQNWVHDGETAGTTGQSLRLEAIKINIVKSSDNQLKNQINLKNVEKTVYTNLTTTFSDFLNNHQSEVYYGKTASKTTVASYSNPNNLQTTDKKFQFLKINTYRDVQSVDKLNAALAGMGTLEGKGQTFITAAQKYNIDPVYLVSHALWETGKGASPLSKGLVVTQFKGQPVTPTKVYNFFGIGAIDTCSLGGGASRAYTEGWTSPEAAIIGGTKWISENYIIGKTNYPQASVYYMRWNAKYPWHEYATDVNWANGIAGYMRQLSPLYKGATLTYDIPVFKQ